MTALRLITIMFASLSMGLAYSHLMRRVSMMKTVRGTHTLTAHHAG